MSKLIQPNRDDHPEAAGKHLEDATVLMVARRYDGAAYLAGYVAECTIKSLILLEHGQQAWGHRLNKLSQQAQRLAALPGSRSAKYSAILARSSNPNGIMNPSTGWYPDLRYRPSNMIPQQQASDWLTEAQEIYAQSIIPMRLDGVI